MVYYFRSNVVTPSAYIYAGKDKNENEELIKYGFEEDVCVDNFKGTIALVGSPAIFVDVAQQFHADNLSSAHIYLRLDDCDYTWDAIPPALLEDCAQLTKANSIEGNKKDNVAIVYTPWYNLKKDGSMVVGQVGFKDSKKVKRIHVPTRENPIVNRLNKTKVEEFPDLRQQKEDRNKEIRGKNRAAQQQRQKEELELARERKEKAWQRDHAYDALHSEEALAMSSNADRDANFEDDFM